MTQDKRSTPTEPFVTNDSILAGVIDTFPDCKVTPQFNQITHRVEYLAEGRVRECLEKIYANRKVGALDVLRSIKNCRSAIFDLKGGSKW